MLAFRTGRSDFKFGEVAPYLLRHAATRKGDWVVTVYETIMAACGQQFDKFNVQYTEEEYSKISRTIYHGLRNGTKLSAFQAGLENVAQTLWPTGSVDHVAMRHLGVAAVLQYLTKTETSRMARWFETCCLQGCIISRNPTLRRVRAVKEGVEDENEGGKDKGGKGDGGKDDKGGSDPKVVLPEEPPKPAEKPPPEKMDRPSMPDDAQNAAEATEDGRTIVRYGPDAEDGVVAVVGQNFDKDAAVNHMPVVGCLVGPCQLKPNVYSKTAANFKAAIEERINKKAVKPSLTSKEKQRIGKIISQSISNHETRGVFSKRKIQEWACEHFDLEAIKSGKWSDQRFKASLDNLYSKEKPRYAFKADIKYECMPEGKAPRMLIADGDDGQLMALAVVRCFEDILFHHFESKSIKHCAKHDAMKRVVESLKKTGAGAVEGDGSAWDTTCNVLIRDLVENPVLKHIMKVLVEYGIIPQGWMEEHQAACEQKKLRLFFSNKFEKLSVEIDAIRRSGHRGTSCLNWWINFVLWVCSVFEEPERFLDPLVRVGKDLTGHDRWWNGCFEGDDSLCTMKPPMVENDAMSDIFLAFWKSAGFNMKIVFCGARATFVGWHIGCTEGELNDHRAPELPRALSNSGVSVSTAAIMAAKDANRKQVNVLAAASALARASDFSGIFPSVSNKYLEFAESVSTSNFKDREMSIRAFGEDGFGANEVRERIKERNLLVTPQQEMETMAALGVEATSDEISTFFEYGWSLDPQVLTNYDAFRASLPLSWRAL